MLKTTLKDLLKPHYILAWIGYSFLLIIQNILQYSKENILKDSVQSIFYIVFLGVGVLFAIVISSACFYIYRYKSGKDKFYITKSLLIQRTLNEYDNTQRYLTYLMESTIFTVVSAFLTTSKIKNDIIYFFNISPIMLVMFNVARSFLFLYILFYTVAEMKISLSKQR